MIYSQLSRTRYMCVSHLRAHRDNARLEHPERTLASYVFQEAEGLSREAKLQWAARGGHEVQNLQHDGVVVRLVGGLATRARPSGSSHRRARTRLGTSSRLRPSCEFAAHRGGALSARLRPAATRWTGQAGKAGLSVAMASLCELTPQKAWPPPSRRASSTASWRKRGTPR